MQSHACKVLDVLDLRVAQNDSHARLQVFFPACKLSFCGSPPHSNIKEQVCTMKPAGKCTGQEFQKFARVMSDTTFLIGDTIPFCFMGDSPRIDNIKSLHIINLGYGF